MSSPDHNDLCDFLRSGVEIFTFGGLSVGGGEGGQIDEDIVGDLALTEMLEPLHTVLYLVLVHESLAPGEHVIQLGCYAGPHCLITREVFRFDAIGDDSYLDISRPDDVDDLPALVSPCVWGTSFQVGSARSVQVGGADVGELL